MSISKKRMIEIALAQMNMKFNEMIREEQIYAAFRVHECGEKQAGASSDHKDLSFERARSMATFLWN